MRSYKTPLGEYDSASKRYRPLNYKLPFIPSESKDSRVEDVSEVTRLQSHASLNLLALPQITNDKSHNRKKIRTLQFHTEEDQPDIHLVHTRKRKARHNSVLHPHSIKNGQAYLEESDSRNPWEYLYVPTKKVIEASPAMAIHKNETDTHDNFISQPKVETKKSRKLAHLKPEDYIRSKSRVWDEKQRHTVQFLTENEEINPQNYQTEVLLSKASRLKESREEESSIEKYMRTTNRVHLRADGYLGKTNIYGQCTCQQCLESEQKKGHERSIESQEESLQRRQFFNDLSQFNAFFRRTGELLGCLLLRISHILVLSPNEELFRPKLSCGHIYIVLKGQVMLQDKNHLSYAATGESICEEVLFANSVKYLERLMSQQTYIHRNKALAITKTFLLQLGIRKYYRLHGQLFEAGQSDMAYRLDGLFRINYLSKIKYPRQPQKGK